MNRVRTSRIFLKAQFPKGSKQPQVQQVRRAAHIQFTRIAEGGRDAARMKQLPIQLVAGVKNRRELS